MSWNHGTCSEGTCPFLSHMPTRSLSSNVFKTASVKFWLTSKVNVYLMRWILSTAELRIVVIIFKMHPSEWIISFYLPLTWLFHLHMFPGIHIPESTEPHQVPYHRCLFGGVFPLWVMPRPEDTPGWLGCSPDLPCPSPLLPDLPLDPVLSTSFAHFIFLVFIKIHTWFDRWLTKEFDLQVISSPNFKGSHQLPSSFCVVLKKAQCFQNLEYLAKVFKY